MDMTIDEYDQPVLATWGGGILYRKKGDLAFHSITMKDELPNNTIQSIKKVSVMNTGSAQKTA